jgi:hypothetical protein
MPGYTKAELAKKRVEPTHYRWCRRCRLYWHQRARHVHEGEPAASVGAQSRTATNSAPDDTRPLADNEKRFLDYLVDEALKQWFAENDPERLRSWRSRFE